jgi:catechol 2,3-dioxygenase-like lactoylglutathione lyase family enzyme
MTDGYDPLLIRHLLEQRVEILDPPAEYDYLPGYYALYFLDPDGIKLELTHIANWPPQL